MTDINRVVFLVDGFNVYHSIVEAISLNRISSGKWLNYDTFCGSLLNDVSAIDRPCVVQDIYYFSALATHHVDPSVVARHRTYLKALESSGIIVTLGNFKRKKVWCKHCNQHLVKYEEKETDVNIAVTLMRLFLKDQCETVIIISGDTDLVAAIRAARAECPSKQIGIGFPFKRNNIYFDQVASFSFDLKPKRYSSHQFPNHIALKDGTALFKPVAW